MRSEVSSLDILILSPRRILTTRKIRSSQVLSKVENETKDRRKKMKRKKRSKKTRPAMFKLTRTHEKTQMRHTEKKSQITLLNDSLWQRKIFVRVASQRESQKSPQKKMKTRQKKKWKIYSSLTRKTQKVKSEISLSFARVIHLEFKLFWNMFIS